MTTTMTEANEHVLDRAIQAGKFPPSRRQHYRMLLARDPKGTRKLIARLAAVAGVSEPEPDDGYDPAWLSSGERQRIAAAGGPTQAPPSGPPTSPPNGPPTGPGAAAVSAGQSVIADDSYPREWIAGAQEAQPQTGAVMFANDR